MASTIQQIETPKRARALDTSGNNHHGQIYSGRALEFDGVTDYLDLGATNTFVDFSAETTQANRAWTVACWVKPYVITTETNSMNLIGSGVTQSISYFGLRGAGADVNKLTIFDVGATTWRVSNTALNINTWYRAVWVFDGDTTVSFYLNGVADGTGEIDNTGAYADMALRYIGAFNDNSRFWDGALADLQLWQGAWSADDVAYDYLNPESLVLSNGGTSLTESNLKAWYQMQDGHRGQQSYILDASNTGLGDEIITNNDFASGVMSPWSVSATGDGVAPSVVAITGGYGARILNGASNGIAQMGHGTTVANTIYKLTYRIVSNDGSVSTLGIQFGGTVMNPVSATVGTHVSYFNSGSASGTFYIKRNGASTDLVITDIFLKPVNDKNNATTVFYGDNLLAGVSGAADGDWEDSGNTPTFTAVYAGGSGSGLTYDPDNTSSPLTGSKDAKVTNAAGESAGIISNAITLVTGRTYRLKYNYLTNYNASSQTESLLVKIGETSATDSVHIDTGGGYAGATLQATSKTAVSLEFIHTDSDTEVFLVFFGGNGLVFQIDDLSLAEVGVATGWTDADQQLHIPQTALQSYNELAWFQDKLGNDNPHAYVTHDTDFDPVQGDFTASCWVFQSDAHSNNYVFQKGGGGAAGWQIRTTASGAIQMAVENAAGVLVAGLSADNKMPLGEWVHIVGVVDYGSTSKVYLNGEEIISNDISSVTGNIELTSTGNAKVRMGSWSTSYASGVMNGSATEWSAFKGVAFSAAEVNELYNDGKALDATTHSQVANLKGYWRNDGLNTVWKNIHNPGTHDATFVNGAETILIPQGLDNRDSQGFLMNKQRNTSSLNLTASSDDYVDIPVEIQGSDTLAFLGVGNGFSISCWVKMNNTINAAEWIINRNDATDGYRLGISASEQINFSIEENGNLKTAVTDSAITVGTWYHVVGTFNGDPSNDTNGDILLYINGVTGGGTTDNITNDSNDMDASATVPLTVGLGHTLYANLEIDGVLMYDDVLTQAEVTRNYNATKGSHRN